MVNKVGRVILLVLLALVFMAGTNVAVYNLYLKPSPEEKRTEVLQALKDGGLIEALSDGQYDDSFLLAELRGSNPTDLMSFVRPFEISVVDKEKNVLGQIRGTGMLVQDYVFTSPVLLEFLRNPAVQTALEQGEVVINMKLLSDLGQDDEWKFEPLKDVWVGNNVAVFRRGGSQIFPAPTEFPFRLGRLEDLNLGGRADKLYGIGSASLEEGKMMLYSYQGATGFARSNHGIIVFDAPLFNSDFGGPVFAIRDGKFELIGIVQFAEGGRVKAIGFQTIIDEAKAAGFIMEIKFADS